MYANFIPNTKYLGHTRVIPTTKSSQQGRSGRGTYFTTTTTTGILAVLHDASQARTTWRQKSIAHEAVWPKVHPASEARRVVKGRIIRRARQQLSRGLTQGSIIALFNPYPHRQIYPVARNQAACRARRNITKSYSEKRAILKQKYRPKIYERHGCKTRKQMNQNNAQSTQKARRQLHKLRDKRRETKEIERAGQKKNDTTNFTRRPS